MSLEVGIMAEALSILGKEMGQLPGFGKYECRRLAEKYHSNEPVILEAVERYSPEQFLRLFLTAHGMRPAGTWQTHTYARVADSVTGQDHFFLIPIPFERRKSATEQARVTARPNIRFENRILWIDDIQTAVRPQSIPYTTPFWYFHYNPNSEQRPFSSMTLNLKPACPEKCTLCAGAKTGRVNNGMDGTLPVNSTFERIFSQHPGTKEQLDSVAVVTGCFNTFDALAAHLTEVQEAVEQYASPRTYRVLEHNVTTEEQFKLVVGELGYEVFITLECFDQNLRELALNGKVGRKGRDSSEFLEMIRVYAKYLHSRPELQKRIVRVNYLVGIDSLETTEYLFSKLSEINREFSNISVIPWLSVFTPYDGSMREIQNSEFSLRFLIDAQDLAKTYFDPILVASESGSTQEGYARGLF